jgi:hypothetical protein
MPWCRMGSAEPHTSTLESPGIELQVGPAEAVPLTALGMEQAVALDPAPLLLLALELLLAWAQILQVGA